MEMRSQTGVQDSVKVAEIFALALLRFAVAVSHGSSSIFACLQLRFRTKSARIFGPDLREVASKGIRQVQRVVIPA